MWISLNKLLIKVNIGVLLEERYKNPVNSTKNEEKTQIQKCSVPRTTECKIINIPLLIFANYNKISMSYTVKNWIFLRRSGFSTSRMGLILRRDGPPTLFWKMILIYKWDSSLLEIHLTYIWDLSIMYKRLQISLFIHE